MSDQPQIPDPDQSIPEPLRYEDRGADLADELRTQAANLRESTGDYDIADLCDQAAGVVEWAGDRADGLQSHDAEAKLAQVREAAQEVVDLESRSLPLESGESMRAAAMSKLRRVLNDSDPGEVDNG